MECHALCALAGRGATSKAATPRPRGRGCEGESRAVEAELLQAMFDVGYFPPNTPLRRSNERLCGLQRSASTLRWSKARRAVPTKAFREAPMSRYLRLKIEGGTLLYTPALADRGTDLLCPSPCLLAELVIDDASP
jgi:hypothetical protein